jgi:hypothetical protein
MIEVECDDFPAETGWTLRDSAGTLIAGQSTGSISNEGGAVFKTAHIAEGAYTFEMAGTYGDGEFKITVKGEPVAISSAAESQDVARESFDVVGRRTGAVVDYLLDEYPYDASWSLQSLTTGYVVAASGFDEVAELCYLLSQSVGVVPGDEYQLVVLASVGGGMCCGYGDGSAALYAANCRRF